MTARLVASAVLAVALGLVLRLGHAERLGGSLEPWEADGFVHAFVGRPLSLLEPSAPLNRLRAPLAPAAWHAAAEAAGADTVAAVRRVGAVGSLLGLGGILALAVAVGARTRTTLHVPARAACWGAWWWALHPTLIAASVRPAPQLVTAFGLCLTLAGLVRRGWLLAAAGAVVAVLAGGVLVAGALVLGLLVYLLPLPPFGRALPATLVVALALCAGWQAQRPADPERPWLPNTDVVHGAAALVDLPLDTDEATLPDADLRVVLHAERTRAAVRAAGPLAVARAALRRGVFDLASPARFAGTPGAPAIGLFDLFLRGGLLLFALGAAAGLRGAGRVAVGVALAALAGGLLLGATSPFAAATLDPVLVGLAAGGMAGADPARGRLRRRAFAIGGVLLLAPGVVALADGRPLSPWITTLGQDRSRALTAAFLLESGGPGDDLPGRLTLSAALQAPELPFLRLPEPALAQAEAALALAPYDLVPTRAVVFGYVENLRFDAALELATEAFVASGLGDRMAKVLVDSVHHERRRVEEARLR